MIKAVVFSLILAVATALPAKPIDAKSPLSAEKAVDPRSALFFVQQPYHYQSQQVLAKEESSPEAGKLSGYSLVQVPYHMPINMEYHSQINDANLVRNPGYGLAETPYHMPINQQYHVQINDPSIVRKPSFSLFQVPYHMPITDKYQQRKEIAYYPNYAPYTSLVLTPGGFGVNTAQEFVAQDGTRYILTPVDAEPTTDSQLS